MSRVQTTESDARLLEVYLRDALKIQDGMGSVMNALAERIVEQDIEGLEACLVEAEPKLKGMEALESNRRKIFSHLERVTGRSFRRDGVDSVIAALPRSEQAGLRELLGEARSAAKDLRRAANKTGMLARQAMSFDRELLNAILCLGESMTTYGADGEMRRAAEASLDRSL
ncbi:MAG TPA: hypothetical protein ENK43_11310 [Planctomycetes bacterium]|nr:hypothetical protein [Planctomycetota bacterium]